MNKRVSITTMFGCVVVSLVSPVMAQETVSLPKMYHVTEIAPDDPTGEIDKAAERLSQKAFDLEAEGDRYRKDGNLEQALASYRAAFDTDRWGRYRMKLIDVLVQLGRKKEALDHYREELYPYPGKDPASYTNDPRILLPFALLLNEERQWQEAVTVYRQALPFVEKELERRYAPIPLNDKGKVLVRHLLLKVGSSFNIHVPERRRFEIAARLALAVSQQNDTETTRQELDKVLALEPNHAVALLYRGRSLGIEVNAKAVPYYVAAYQYGTAEVRAAVVKDISFGNGPIQEMFQKELAGSPPQAR